MELYYLWSFVLLQFYYLQYNESLDSSLFFVCKGVDMDKMIYKCKYREELSEWEAFYSIFIEKAENCFIRWLNQDEELTEAEVKLAREYQALIEEDTDFIEIEIPPDNEVSPEEWQALVKIADKLQQSGLVSILQAMLGISDSMKRNEDMWKSLH